MRILKLSPVLAAFLVIACGNGAPPPAAAPSPAASEAPAPSATPASDSQSAGDAGPPAAPKTRGELEVEAARIDAALNDLARRLQSAQEASKAELQHQLEILQKRNADLKAQLQAVEGPDGGADKAGREIHRALGMLQGDMKKLEKQIAP
jgi:hypothetical protein